MILFKKADALSAYLSGQRRQPQRIGFVPTMGALHEGHLSLIAESKRETDLTVCSVFVNPTQFNNPDDLKHYPVTIEADISRLLQAGCDLLFLPAVDEIYPPGYKAPRYDLGKLETLLEGKHRPGHFQGVCQVVDRLLRTVEPHRLYLGQKDYQQCMVIGRLLEIMGRQAAIKLVVVPTMREADGLALSSRNLRLCPDERAKAPLLHQALQTAQSRLASASINVIKSEATAFLTAQGFAVDYFEIADAQTLEPANAAQGNLIALVAAQLGPVRLIDNLPVN